MFIHLHLSSHFHKTLSSYLFQNSADPLSGSVFVVLGVPGQQFQDSLSAVRQPGKHIGEGTAAVDGKLKFPFSLSHSEERVNSCSRVCNYEWGQRRLRERERLAIHILEQYR